MLDEQFAAPKEVNAAIRAANALNRFLEGGDAAALEAENFKEFIPEALVLGPYDKNIGRLDVYCPSILHQHMADNFWNNKKNYT